jgi:hypothetical protein
MYDTLNRIHIYTYNDARFRWKLAEMIGLIKKSGAGISPRL